MLRKGDLVKWLGSTFPFDQAQLGIIAEDQKKGFTSIFVYWLGSSLNTKVRVREPILWLERLRKESGGLK